MFAVNLVVFLTISYARYGFFTAAALTNILVFVLLLSLIITLYDRYRPIYLVRFFGFYY
jgi:chromate transport protein ChrA